MDFGDRLRRLLQEKGMSVTELAEASGVNRNTLYSYLRRNTRKPDPVVLEKIAPVLGTSVVSLLGMKVKETGQKRMQVRRTASAEGQKLQRSRRIAEEAVSADEEDLWGIRETLRRRPEMRTLFSLGRKATPEQIRQAIRIIEVLRGNEDEF